MIDRFILSNYKSSIVLSLKADHVVTDWIVPRECPSLIQPPMGKEIAQILFFSLEPAKLRLVVMFEEVAALRLQENLVED